MKATILFTKCIQDAQEYGSDDEYMVSRLFFTIKTPDDISTNLTADIKQVVGGNYESDPLEVFLPPNFDLNLDYQQFRDAAENYYRSLVGSSASGIRIQGATNVRMHNNIYEIAKEYEVDVK